MKPAAFTFHMARSLDEAVALLAAHGDAAKLLAGGQSLVPMMNLRLAQPQHVIDINQLGGLDEVRLAGERLEIGALIRHQALAGAALVGARCPILAAAAASIGHYAIRTRGTLGGSLAHADPAAQLPLIAVLLDAELEAGSPRGSRVIPANAFFAGVFTTALAADEILTAVRVPCLQAREGWGFRLMARRVGDFAIAAAAVRLALDPEGAVAGVRLALGGVEAAPVAPGDLAAAQRGRIPDAAWIAGLARDAAATCSPVDDPRVPAAYRRELAEVLLARALDDALGRARSAVS